MARASRGAWRALSIGVALGCATLVGGSAMARGIDDELKKLIGERPKSSERHLGQLVAEEAPGGPVSLDQAVAKVRAKYPKAEVVSAQTRDTERGAVHVIKLLKSNGKVKVIRIDAATGAPVG